MIKSPISFGSNFKKGLITSKRVFSLVVDDLINKTFSTSNYPGNNKPEESKIKINHQSEYLQSQKLYEDIIDKTIEHESLKYYQTMNKIAEQSNNLKNLQSQLTSQEQKAATMIPGEESNLNDLKNEIITNNENTEQILKKPNISNIPNKKRAILIGFYSGLTFCAVLLILLKR